jgi:arylsulfatase A-like enzyme
VHWPKQLRPRIVNDVTSVYDLLPTLLSVAAGYDETRRERTPAVDAALLEGMNIWPVLAGTGSVGPRVLYWNTGRQCACRVGDWKLIQDRKNGLVELFNLADDPYELTDLAQEELDQVQVMLNALRRQQALDPGSPGAR